MDARRISVEVTSGDTCFMHQVWLPGLMVEEGIYEAVACGAAPNRDENVPLVGEQDVEAGPARQ